MPILHGQHDGNRALVPVAILGTTNDGGLTLPSSEDLAAFRALVDTGATGTAVTGRVVSSAQLKPISKRKVLGVSGAMISNVYQFRLGFVLQNQSPDGSAETGISFVGGMLQGTELAGEHDFDVLLGMDVLRHCQLTLLPSRQFTIAF